MLCPALVLAVVCPGGNRTSTAPAREAVYSALLGDEPPSGWTLPVMRAIPGDAIGLGPPEVCHISAISNVLCASPERREAALKTLLRIDASIRTSGSVTRILTDYFQSRWQEVNPTGVVIGRCLANDPIPHLSNETFKSFHQEGRCSRTTALADLLNDEIKRADHVLIGSPLYNLTLPSTLKAYFDHIVRSGATFEVKDGTYRGLLHGKGATVITARGGVTSPGSRDDFQTAYLEAILAFIGVESVDIVAMEGTALDNEAATKAIVCAKRQIDGLFDRMEGLIWSGEFSEADRRQIGTLRAGQAEAIVAGDAAAYAALCTDDIQLLIPGGDVVSGRAAFLQVEEALFRSAVFASFRKFPLRIERGGNLAVEVGRQEVRMMQSNHASGVFCTRQKYTHVFRLTAEGWRFALLMSNATQ